MNFKTTIKKVPSPFLFFKVLAMMLALVSFEQTKAQNTCATALNINTGMFVVDAINGTNISAGCSSAALAEWYVYTPIENHLVTVTSDLDVNVCKDTNFSVYTGTCGALTCYVNDDDSGNVLCNGSSSFLSTKTFEAFAGTTYYIAWDNKWQVTGFTFQLIENPYVENPCNTATVVTAGTTTVASIDALTLTTNCSVATMAKWFKYVPTQDYHLKITSDLQSNVCKDTNFNVYTGTCGTFLSCLTSDDNSGEIVCSESGLSNLSVKTFDVTSGTTYYIVWDNKWSVEGFDFQIIEQEFSYPVNYTNTTIPNLTSTYNTCVVDMNGDGKDDIAGVSSNILRIHTQGDNGSLAFNDFLIPGNHNMPSWSIAAGDYNKDGFTDLLLGSGQGLTFWRSNDTGTAYTGITPGQYIFCQRTNFIDINNDGNLDAFSCHDIAPNCYYLNDGSGNMNFYQSSGANLFGSVGGNYASIWTDYDNDGDQDMFVSKCSGPPCELHRNNGDGSFTDVASVSGLNFQPVQSWSSSIGDFDNDGDMDILVGSNGGSASRLFRNDLNLGLNADAFTNITSGSGWDINMDSNRDYIAYDFDNDGFLDVLGGGSKIMFGQGDGTFLSTAYNGNINVGAVGDLNSDGFLDIIDWNTVRMAVPNGNNWIAIHLKGIQSNSNGIGARVEIHGSWGIQIRDIRSGEGFEYMSTLNAHFGIGQAETIDSVIIRWPSGVVDVIENPTINQFLNVIEASSPLSNASVSDGGFGIYPNPAKDHITITKQPFAPQIISTEIFDLAGRLISNPSLENDQISVKVLSEGTYILVLRLADGKSYAEKFIKR